MERIKLVHTDTLSCEAILRKAPNGELIIVSQCGGVKEPEPNNRVYVFHSKDDGETWSKGELITADNGKAQYQTEVSVVGDEILCFMTEHDGNFTNFNSYVLSSKDNGYTFQKKCDLTLKKGFCFVRGMIKVGNEYLFPYQNYPVSKQEDEYLISKGLKIWNSNIENVEMGVIKTSDFINFTVSTKEALLPLRMNGEKKWVWSEPTLIELSNGDIAMLLRFDARGYLYRSISKDGGDTWSEPVPTDIPNPANKPKLIKLGNRIALLNTPKSTGGYINRQPLSLWISDDDMLTWSYKKDLVTFPGWLSYPDGVAVADNRIQFAFEFNRHDVYFVDVTI